MKMIPLILIIIYWIIMSIVFSNSLESPYSSQGYTGNTNVTGSIDTSGTPTGFIITDIFRILGMVFLAIGLPATTPGFILILYGIWAWFVNVVFIISLIA